MATLATLQARLDALDGMIASGVLQTRHGDTMLTFRSTTELLKARQFVQDQIDDANGTSRRRVHYAYQSGKGL
jgi:hypothetical protein